MASSTINDRVESIRKAHVSYDVDKLMSHYSEDSTYNDYGLNVLNMDKSGAGKFHAGTWDLLEELKITTRAHNGTDDMSVWEWDIEFKYVKSSPMVPMEANGQVLKMVGCSIIWWNREGKIYKQNDYAAFAKN